MVMVCLRYTTLGLVEVLRFAFTSLDPVFLHRERSRDLTHTKNKKQGVIFVSAIGEGRRLYRTIKEILN